eukprot:Lankesteria_metandrocarpae@DN5059_c0_g1_i1.p1
MVDKVIVLVLWLQLYSQCDFFQRFSPLTFVDGKVVNRTVWANITTEPIIHYVDRFGCTTGNCKFDFRVNYKNMQSFMSGIPVWTTTAQNKWNKAKRPELKLAVFLDEEWELLRIRKQPLCEHLTRARVVKPITIEPDGETLVSGELSQWIRPHVWYFVLADCEDQIVTGLSNATAIPVETFKRRVNEKQRRVQKLGVQYSLLVKQPDGSHLSYEMICSSVFNLFGLAAFATLFMFLMVKEVRQLKKTGMGFHPLLIMVNAAFVLQIIGLSFSLLHLYLYSALGRNFVVAEAVSEVLLLLARTVMTFFTIFVALGFGLNVAKRVPTEALLAVSAFVLCLKLSIVTLDKMAVDERLRFHSLDGWSSVMLCVVHVALWILFVVSAVYTSKISSALSSFLRGRFFLAASMFLLSFPFLSLVTAGFAPYLRQRVFLVGSLGVQLVSLYWLGWLMISEKGDFFRVSQLSRSLLPVSVIPAVGTVSYSFFLMQGSFFSAGNHVHDD